ncbi:hypothetical protein B0T26DRAFT_754156 [Lasiosphaeria miniovina]|uniref:C3H1-type domain-containing protein n=1 Tax=Lasiosphaeria miniovina TaxID=1954250 RepID=A0AA40AE35_9PEZI|nr:uncharacterized protein B0T26DRAFT_754156 [Lasiosphaeria miniovina]KAK0714122.1 hypothetical protein B0T26DRAFT_754156 [Lasiosphaeria miniovina]
MALSRVRGHPAIAKPPCAPRNEHRALPRSAPKLTGASLATDTSHVPCKFFRQGACQAGNACPFSHDLSQAAENVCKYFAKGNCKFGPKCANIHVLPDGRRINYGKNGVTIGSSPVTLGARLNPTTYHTPSNSALTNSFLRADALPPYTATSPYALQDDRYSHQLGRQPSLENGLPVIDTTYTSNPASAYGSPRDEDVNRFGLGLSPVNVKGLSVLDAPLPASFDSNGISHAARYGPWPSSMPSKFGLESPSPSLNSAKDARTSETLKLLHTSAFGSSEHLSPSALAAAEVNGFASSPPTGSAMHGAALANDEYFGRRAMHSSSLRYTKPRLMSSSAPKIDRDWETEFLFEEDYVPGALANEVLTPAEKARRGSATHTLRAVDMEQQMPESSPVSKFGSPLTASSPSRWGTLFQRQKEEDALQDNGTSYTGGSGRSLKHTSAFGHVGSPLRNSSLAGALNAELNGDSANGKSASASWQNDSLALLTQQMQRTRLAEDASGGSSPHLHPHVTRNPSSNGLGSISAGVIGKEREKERGLERHVSSGSIGSSVTGRFTTPIDEEDTSFVFSMEDEDEEQIRARKRASGGHLGATSPLNNEWSYAAAVASNRNIASGAGVNNARNGASTVETVGGR